MKLQGISFSTRPIVELFAGNDVFSFTCLHRLSTLCYWADSSMPGASLTVVEDDESDKESVDKGLLTESEA